MSFNEQEFLSNAIQEGYSPEEIVNFLGQREEYSPFINQSIEKGFQPVEIVDFLQNKPEPKKTVGEQILGGVRKAGRLGAQLGIGAVQKAALPYDLSIMISKEYGETVAPQVMRQNILDDLINMSEMKQLGVWDDSDQNRYDYLKSLIENPDKMKESLNYVIPNLDSASLIEKGAKQFGIDLSPEDYLETAVRFAGLMNNPKKGIDLVKGDLSPTKVIDLVKEALPKGKTLAKAGGTVAGLAYANQAELGPIGILTSMALGDLLVEGGIGVKNLTKLPSYVKNYKQNLAKGIASFTKKDQRELQREMIKQFREAGIQADVGTLTNSNLVKNIQNILAQSGLTGEALDIFKKNITNQLVNEYKNIADILGESIFDSRQQAGTILQEALNNARAESTEVYRNIYENVLNNFGEEQIFTGNIAKKTKEIKDKLSPGTIKTAAKTTTLAALDDLESDILTVGGDIKSADLMTLINDKIALEDKINYEVQGTPKKLLIGVVKEIDKAIENHAERNNTRMFKDWQLANKNFSQHAKTFRNKAISQGIFSQDPSKVFSLMDTPEGVNKVKKALSYLPEGVQSFNELARYKLDELIGKNMVDSVTKQANFGKFSKLLEKQQNRQLVNNLIGNDGLKRLERLQTVSGTLADTAQKFFNASKSGAYAADIGFAAKLFKDFANLFSGNPFPLMKSGSFWLTSRQLTKLISDPEFLRLIEEEILSNPAKNRQSIINSSLRLGERAENLLKQDLTRRQIEAE